MCCVWLGQGSIKNKPPSGGCGVCEDIIVDSDKKRIILRILLFLFILGTGLYFGIRIGEGQYNFYKPESPYYQKAVRDAQNDGYSEGWDAGHKDKQEKDYNSGWSAGYEFCLNENKAIRNNYDEGYNDGYDSGYEDGYSEGYDEGFSEASSDLS